MTGCACGAAAFVFAALAAAPAGAAAPAAAKDGAAVETCLKRAGSNPAECIGVVAGACEQQPGFGSTPGMIICNRRELAVWDERLNRFYHATIATGGKAATAVRRAERAWLALRDAKCALPAIEEEGGSAVGPMASECLLDETARQALWLESLDLYPSRTK